MKSQPAPPEAGDELVSRIKDLDKSTAPFALLLPDVFQLLDLSSDTCNPVPSPQELEQEYAHGFSPLDEWALRWLLRRMSLKGQEGDSPRLHRQSWYLLLKLAVRLNLKPIARLFSEFKLSIILEQTIKRVCELAQEWEQHERHPKAIKELNLKYEHSFSSFTYNATRKRKRTHTSGLATTEQSMIVENLLSLLTCVAQVLEHVKLRVSKRSDVSEVYAREHLRSSLRMDTEQTNQTFGYFLTSMRVMITHGKALQVNSSQMPVDLLGPFMFVWEVRTTGSSDQAELSDASNFCKFCLVPALELACSSQLIQEDDCLNLQSLICSQCFEPSLRRFSLEKTPVGSDQEAPQALLDEALESLETMNNAVSERHTEANGNISGNVVVDAKQSLEKGPESPEVSTADEASSQLSPVSMLLKFAVEFCVRGGRKPEPMQASWLSQVFVDLARSLGINLEQAWSIPPDHSLQTLSGMLRISLNFNVSLDRNILSNVSLHFCGLSNNGPSPSDGWARLSTCINLDPSIVTRSLSPAKATELGPVSPVLKLMLEAIAASGGHTTSLPPEVGNAVIAMVDAFTRARETTRFIRIWQSQLAKEVKGAYDAERDDDDGSFACSIWSDDNVCRSIAPKLLSSLNYSQVRHIFVEFDTALSEDDRAEDQLRRLWVLVVVAHCLLSASWDEKFREVLTDTSRSIHQHTLRILSGSYPVRLRAKIWQALAIAHEGWPEMQAEDNIRTTSDILLTCAEKELSTALELHEALRQPSIELSLSAWVYVTVCAASEWGDSAGAGARSVTLLNSVVASALQPLEVYSTRRRDSHSTSIRLLGWDGSISTVTSTEHFLLLVLAVPLVRVHRLEPLRPEVLQKYIKKVHSLAFLEVLDGGDLSLGNGLGLMQSCTSWLALWQVMNFIAAAGDSKRFAGLLQDATILYYVRTEVSPIPSPQGRPSAVEYSQCLTNLSIRSLIASGMNEPPAHSRIEFVDKLWCSLLSSWLEAETRPVAIELLLRVLSPHKRSMKLFQDPHSIETLARHMDTLSVHELEPCLPLLRLLAEEISIFASSAAASQGTTTFLDDFRVSLLAMAEKRDALRALVATWVMGTAALGHLYKSSTHAMTRDNKTRKVYLQRMIQSLSALEITEKEVQPRLLPLLEAIATFSDLLLDAPRTVVVPYSQARPFEGNTPLLVDEDVEVEGLFGSIGSQLECLLDSVTDRHGSKKKAIARSLVTNRRILRCILHSQERSLSAKEMVAELEHLETLAESIQHTRNFLKAFRNSDTHRKAAYIKELATLPISQQSQRQCFILLRAIVSAPFGADDRTEEVRAALSYTLNEVVGSITSIQTKTSYRATLVLDSMLRNNAWMITQWHIDSLLAAISIQTSPQATLSAKDNPRRVFSSLCQLFQSILTAHRSRINGRYHLVVDALHGLLCCLFHPYTSNHADAGIKQPPWLYLADSENSRNPLEEAHAKSFARLLTTICDPSPGTIRPPRGNRDVPRHDRQLLNDGIKKARAIAGQHLQYVMAEFCQLQLRGRLTPAMRSALNSGLYAMFNAMSVEIQRTANASLDEQGRAIFKAVYDDYVKFGKWEGA